MSKDERADSFHYTCRRNVHTSAMIKKTDPAFDHTVDNECVFFFFFNIPLRIIAIFVHDS